MLSQLQEQLATIYGVEATHDVRDFLITDPVLAKVLSGGAMATNNDETLLVAEDGDGVAMSLFLDGDMLERLEGALHCLHVDHLDDLWKVLEGISHFNCMAWKARREREVSLLELELQGEIDKFLGSLLLANGQDNNEMLACIHGWLFEATRFRDDLDGAELDRYRAASSYASRYCHRIQVQWRETGDLPFDELRAFFRLQLNEKISRIHSQAWGHT